MHHLLEVAFTFLIRSTFPATALGEKPGSDPGLARADTPMDDQLSGWRVSYELPPGA